MKQRHILSLIMAFVLFTPLTSQASIVDDVLCFFKSCTKTPSTVITQNQGNVTSQTNNAVANSVSQGSVGASSASTSVSTSFTTSDKITVVNLPDLLQTLSKNTQDLGLIGNMYLENAKSTQAFLEKTVAAPPTIPIANPPQGSFSVGPQPFEVHLASSDMDALSKLFVDLISALHSIQISPTVQVSQPNQVLTLDATSTAALVAIASSTNNMSFNPNTGGTPSGLQSATLTQAAHGFAIGDFIYFTGTVYALASAAAPTTAETVGMVTSVPTANTFTYASAGQITGLTGLTAGQVYYLSTVGTTGNTFTATEPTAVSSVSKPLFIALSTTTAIFENIERGTPAQGQTAVVQSGSNLTITNAQTTASTSFVNVTGGTFVLPVGVFDVTFNIVTGNGASGDNTFFQVLDPSSALVPNSSFISNSQAIVSGRQMVTWKTQITVTTAGTYTLQWKTDANTSTIYNNPTVAGGASQIIWTQIGAAPVPMSFLGEFGQNTTITNAQTTTSTTFVDVTGGSFTLPTAGTWEIITNINALNSANNFTEFQVTDNAGNVVANSMVKAIGTAAGNNLVSTPFPILNIVTTGSATYKLQWRVGAGTGSIYNVSSAANTFGGFSTITYQKISGFIPITGQTVDYVQVRLSATVTGLANNGTILFDTVESGNIPYNTTTGQFSLTAGKTYEIRSNVSENTNATNLVTAWFNVTAGATMSGGSGASTSSGTQPNGAQAVTIFTPAVNTIIALRNTTGGARDVGGGALGVQASTASIVQIGSSATITQATRPIVIANNSSAQSIPNNTTTNITGWSELTDTTNSFAPATGTFTAPVTGQYQINASIRMTPASGVTAGSIVAVDLFKNGTIVAAGQLFGYPAASTATALVSAGGYWIISLNVGDTLNANIFQNTGAARTLSATALDNNFSIQLISPTY